MKAKIFSKASFIGEKSPSGMIEWIEVSFSWKKKNERKIDHDIENNEIIESFVHYFDLALFINLLNTYIYYYLLQILSFVIWKSYRMSTLWMSQKTFVNWSKNIIVHF